MIIVSKNLNSIEVLISKALIDSNISLDEFLLENNMLKEYDDMKKWKILIINKYVLYNQTNITSSVGK